MALFPTFNKAHEAYILSKDEVSRLIAASDPMLASMVRFGLCSGLTLEETTNLRIMDLDTASQIVRVVTQKSQRVVYVPVAALEPVRKYMNNGHGPGDFLFGYGKGQLASKLKEASKRALKREIVWQDIIHSYVNFAARAQPQVPMQLVAANLGITADRLGAQYGVTPDDARRILNSGFNGF